MEPQSKAGMSLGGRLRIISVHLTAQGHDGHKDEQVAALGNPGAAAAYFVSILQNVRASESQKAVSFPPAFCRPLLKTMV
jgi:hypothetical protein